MPEADAGGVRSDALREFLYVGKIAHAKGISTLVEFVDTFRETASRSASTSSVSGRTSRRRRRSRRRCARRGLSDLIVFHGRLVGDDKWRVYARAHVLLHPTYWDGQPVTILEALAFGLPVVATRIGAIPDTIATGDEGYLMSDNSSAEVRAGVETIIRDERTYDGYRSRARASYRTALHAARCSDRGWRMLLESAAEAVGAPSRTPQPGPRAAMTAPIARKRGLVRCCR